MLRKQSRPISSEQAAMADFATPRENYRRPSSAFSNSPRLFTVFASKGTTDSESLMSPTSILDSNKPFSASPRTPSRLENKLHWEKLDSGGVGLGILDVLTEGKTESKLLKSENPKVLFSSQLKIQIPLMLSANSPFDSPKSPADFGTKTKNSQMGCSSSSVSCVKKSDSPLVYSGLSIDEMELSEDYTCVISHGPNPRTTHIFDDCVLESCCGSLGVPSNRRGKESFINHSMSYPSETFLSFCHSCKKNLGQGKDIYIYRGEKAFCSSECRDKLMILEEGNEGMDFDG